MIQPNTCGTNKKKTIRINLNNSNTIFNPFRLSSPLTPTGGVNRNLYITILHPAGLLHSCLAPVRVGVAAALLTGFPLYLRDGDIMHNWYVRHG